MTTARALSLGLGISIVTNSPRIAAGLAAAEDIDPIMTGGRIDRRAGAALAAFDFEDAEFKGAAARSAPIVVAMTTEKLDTAARLRLFRRRS